MTAGRTPTYRLHKPTGQAVVTIDGRDRCLGKYGTDQSRDVYDRVVGEWLARGRQSGGGPDPGIVVAQLLAPYWRFATPYYQKNGRPTVEIAKLKAAFRPLKRLYGRTSASDFGPLSLKTVREELVRAGLSRRHMNDQINRIKRMFKW